MAINWRLKTYLFTKHSISSITELRKVISKKTGIVISLQNLSNIVNKKPVQIRLGTMEIICSALDCHLSDFLEIKPKNYQKSEEKRKLSFKNTPHSQRAKKAFPEPKDYI